jgi:hypothetical protein
MFFKMIIVEEMESRRPPYASDGDEDATLNRVVEDIFKEWTKQGRRKGHNKSAVS